MVLEAHLRKREKKWSYPFTSSAKNLLFHYSSGIISHVISYSYVCIIRSTMWLSSFGLLIQRALQLSNEAHKAQSSRRSLLRLLSAPECHSSHCRRSADLCSCVFSTWNAMIFSTVFFNLFPPYSLTPRTQEWFLVSFQELLKLCSTQQTALQFCIRGKGEGRKDPCLQSC